jgi:hypothetical protein
MGRFQVGFLVIVTFMGVCAVLWDEVFCFITISIHSSIAVRENWAIAALGGDI